MLKQRGGIRGGNEDETINLFGRSDDTETVNSDLNRHSGIISGNPRRVVVATGHIGQGIQVDVYLSLNVSAMSTLH